MDKLASNIVNFCSSVSIYAYVLAIVAALIVGVMMLIPSEKCHAFALKYGGLAIVGTILIAGCVTLGKWIAGNWTF